MKLFLPRVAATIVAAVLSIASASAVAATAEKSRYWTYAFERGDTLTKVFGKDAKVVCEDNELLNCNRVFVGQVVWVRPSITSREVKPVAKVAQAPKAAVAKREAKPVREESCIKLGVAPYNRDGDMKLRLQGIDLSPALGDAEKAEAKELIKAGRGERMLVTSDMVFEAMPFRSKDGQVKFVKNAKVCTPEQGGRPEVLEVWKLSTGKLVGDPTSCGNIGPVLMSLRPEPKPEPPQPKQPEPQKEPEPPAKVVQEPEPKQADPEPQKEPVIPEAKPISCLKPEGVGGQEFEPRYRGASTKATYVAGDIRCVWYDNDEYQISSGIGGTWVGWDGRQANGGSYDGYHYLYGLSTKVVSHNDGWDAAARFPAFGYFHSSYQRAAYQNDRHFKIAGLTLSVNNFERKLEGKEWWYETQVNFAFAKPLESTVGHTIFGQPLADTKGLGLDHYANLTVRQYITRVSEHGELYGQLGLNIEKPVSRSLSGRIGLAMYERCVGVGAGVDHDLITHGTVPAIGYWVDPFQCGEAYRVHVRGQQITVEAKQKGINFDPSSIGPAPKP